MIERPQRRSERAFGVEYRKISLIGDRFVYVFGTELIRFEFSLTEQKIIRVFISDDLQNFFFGIRFRDSVCVFIPIVRIALEYDALRRRIFCDIPLARRRERSRRRRDAEKIFYRIDTARLFCRTIDKRRTDIHIDCKEGFGDDARKQKIETLFIDLYDIDMTDGTVVHRHKLLRIT